MNLKLNFVSALLFFLLLTCCFQIPLSFEQAPAVLSSFVVLDPNGNDITDKSLVAGGAYTVKFTIEIGATLSDNILLSTSMKKSGNEFWTLENNYAGVDTSTWTPGSQSIMFQAKEGIAEFTLNGMIPGDITEQQLQDIQKTVHSLQQFSILILSLESMEILDDKTYTITDQTIITYENLLSDKRKILSETSMDAKYSELALSIVNEAETLTSFGFYDDAIVLLSTIPNSDFPEPPMTTTLYMAASISFALISLILAFLFYRARTSNSFLVSYVNDKANRLDLVLVRAQRIDKELATEIESIKKELEHLE